MTYEFYINQIKKYLLKKGSEQILKLIIAKLPFMSFGPLSYVAIIIIEWILEKAFDETEMRIFFKYIDIRTDIQGRKLYEAIEKNKTVQDSGSDEEKKESEKILIDNFRNFVKLSS